MAITMDKDRRGGRPCIEGTRFTVAQLVAELSEGRSLGQVTFNFSINNKAAIEALQELARYLDKPFAMKDVP